MRAAGRLAVCIASLAGAAALAAGAIASGVAGNAAYDAAKEMSTWAASGNEPGAETVAWLVADLERAVRLTPGDPNIEELLGGLALHRIERAAFLDEALGHYRRAVALRPSSPYPWASIAAADYRKGDTGREFQAALRHAAALGPAEPEVQRVVADYGLAVWDEAPQATRVAVESAITGAMKRDPGEALRLAQRRGRLGIACRHLGDAAAPIDPRWQGVCGSREDPR